MKRPDTPIYRRLVYVGAGVWAVNIGIGMSTTPYSQVIVTLAGVIMILAGIFGGPLK